MLQYLDVDHGPIFSRHILQQYNLKYIKFENICIWLKIYIENIMK